MGRGKYSPCFSSGKNEGCEKGGNIPLFTLGKDEGCGTGENSKRRIKVYKEGREERVNGRSGKG